MARVHISTVEASNSRSLHARLSVCQQLMYSIINSFFIVLCLSA